MKDNIGKKLLYQNIIFKLRVIKEKDWRLFFYVTPMMLHSANISFSLYFKEFTVEPPDLGSPPRMELEVGVSSRADGCCRRVLNTKEVKGSSTFEDNEIHHLVSCQMDVWWRLHCSCAKCEDVACVTMCYHRWAFPVSRRVKQTWGFCPLDHSVIRG